MKAKRITAACCVALSLCLLLATVTGIFTSQPQKAYGSIAQSAPVFGNTQLVLTQSGTGSTVLNLSGTNSTSIPCYGLKLSLATTGATSVLMGSSSSTCTFPVYPTSTSGTAGSQSIEFPAVSNVNQVWFSLSNSTTGTYTANVNAVYAQ
jgi:hypothetical protein